MKYIIPTSLILSGLLHLVTATQGAPGYGLSTLNHDRPIVMGYVNALRSATGQSQTLSPAQIDAEMAALHWEGYDAVVHAFIEPLADGKLDESLGNFKTYQSALLKYAHQNGKSVILSIGGAYPARMADQFLELAGDATKRATFVANCLNYLKTYNYDGIDIDWEFPDHTKNGRALMTQLMTDLYAAVKAEDQDYIVMFGTGPGYYLGSYDFTALKDHCDFFFYFGYDWKTATPTGANGPISAPGSGTQWTTNGDTLFEKSVRAGVQYVIDKGFSASKIICGLPFYGSENTSWAAIRNTYNADKATHDAAIHADALEVKIGTEWFTTPPALKRKMDALLKSDASVLTDKATIRGVGTWEIGHEHSSNPDLSTAFEEWIQNAEELLEPAISKLSIADFQVIEGSDRMNELVFKVSLSAPLTAPATIDYFTYSGSAEAGSDFTTTRGTLSLSSGQSSARVTVPVHPDRTPEDDETMHLYLEKPTGPVAIANRQATGTIINDDLQFINKNVASTVNTQRTWSPPTFLRQATTKDHSKQIIGYITQYDAWKGNNQGLESNGILSQANVDFSKYTILNYSFFGIAKDGSLHSPDLADPDRWENRDRTRAQWVEQEPQNLIHLDFSSSFDYYILYGEINPVNELTPEARAAGFNVKEGTTDIWQWCEGALEGPFPIPVPDPDGAPGIFELGAQNGVKILASLGGWSLSQHFPDLVDPTKRAKLVKDCQSLIKLGFDGIDLDWEFPGPFSGMNFTGSDADYETLALVAEDIRAGIGNDKLLTIAFHSIPNRLTNQKWQRLIAVTDYFNLFGYDFAGGWSNKANHNAPLYLYDTQEDRHSFSGTIDFIENNLHLPLDKFNLGYPSYGRGVITADATAQLGSNTVKQNIHIKPDGPVSSAADVDSWPLDVWDGTPMYFHIKKTRADNPGLWTRYWDDQAKVPYLINGNKFLSYDDPESTAYKAKLYLDRGLAGTIAWTVYGDLEVAGLQPKDDNDRLRTATSVRSNLVDTMNNVFAGIATPDEYDGDSLPEDSVLQQRLEALRANRIKIVVSNVYVHEGADGETVDANFKIQFNKALDSDLQIDYATNAITARDGEDYTAATGSLTINAGQTSGTVTIQVLGDDAEEGDERFSLEITNFAGNIQADSIYIEGVGIATILDDDGIHQPDTGWTRHYGSGTPQQTAVVATVGDPWSNGFTGTITITNNSDDPFTNYTITFDAPWPAGTHWDQNIITWTKSGNTHTVTGTNSIAAKGNFVLNFNGTAAWAPVTNLKINGKDPNQSDDTQLRDWLNQHNLSNNGLDDTDQDFTPDLIEFLLGTAATTISDYPVIIPRYQTLTINGLAAKYFCVEVQADTKAAKVEYRIESSTDLVTWSGGDNFMQLHESSVNPDGSTKALWRESIPDPEKGIKFVRLIAREVTD